MYSVPGIGLQGHNIELLGLVAEVQEATKLPVVVGGDYNYTPSALAGTDYVSRSGIQPAAPADPTHIKRESKRVLDWFLLPEPLTRLTVSIQTHSAAQSAPHRPVQLTLQLSQSARLPVLVTPQRLPRQKPFGPSREVDT